MTVRELRNLLEVEDYDREICIVYHGHDRPSFHLPASDARRGANIDDFLIIVEEPRL